MADPILDAHQESPFCYVISGPQPISIRDQMLRGATIAERLFRRGIIDAGNRELVVCGAGAGGASAAMMASRLGVNTTLVESGSAPFRAQSFTLSRLIDPTQYDWPLDHFGARRLPWHPHHPPLPLPFRAARAAQLALVWLTELQIHAATHPLTLLTGRKVQNIKLLPIASASGPLKCLEVTLDDSRIIQARAYIDAKGFGSERCTIPNEGPFIYEGFPFWGPDTFDRLSSNDHKVLISGSGDGALQDYLRVMTHLPTAADIVAGCNLPLAVTSRMQSAEDRSLRGRSWASDDHPFRAVEEEPYFRELQMAHEQEVQRALSYPQQGLLGSCRDLWSRRTWFIESRTSALITASIAFSPYWYLPTF